MPRKPTKKMTEVEKAMELLTSELNEGSETVDEWLRTEYKESYDLDADTVADAMHGLIPSDLQVFCERLAMRSGPYVRDALVKALGA